MPIEQVVDASAVAKLFLEEPDAAPFRDWWYARLAGGDLMMAPTLLRYEIGNLIARNLGSIDAAGRRRAWRDSVAGIVFDDDHLHEAYSFPDLTFYDAAYVSLAAHRGAALVTFDGRMAGVARSAGVTVTDGAVTR